MLGKPLTQVQQARGGRDAYVPRRSLLSKTGTRGSLPELVRPPTLAHPGPKPGSCSEDGLACALLEVLKNYQAQAPAPVSVPRQSALKPQVPAQSSLALVLHSVLEAAVNNAWDDSKVAERVSAKILTWQKQRHQAVGASESNSESPSLTLLLTPGLLELRAWRLPKERVKAKVNCLAIATRVVRVFTRRLLNLRSLCPTSLKLLLLRSLPTESLPIRISGLSSVWLLLSGAPHLRSLLSEPFARLWRKAASSQAT